MRKGFTLVELLVILVLIAIAVSAMLPVLTTVRERSGDHGCTNRLGQLGKGIQVYFNHDSYGRGRLYPDANGGGFFARLYQVRLWDEPGIFRCPYSTDEIPSDEKLKKLTDEDADQINAISYAGRKNKNQKAYPGLWQWYKDTTGTTIGSDDWQGGPNHEYGRLISVVFLDSHVERIKCPDAKGDDYQAYAAKGSCKRGYAETPIRGIADPLTN